MTDADTTILVFRLMDVALWLLVVLCMLPAVARSLIQKSPRPCDDCRTGLALVAVWIIGNYLIRLTENDNVWALAGLNAMAAALAVYVLILARQHKGE